MCLQAYLSIYHHGWGFFCFFFLIYLFFKSIIRKWQVQRSFQKSGQKTPRNSSPKKDSTFTKRHVGDFPNIWQKVLWWDETWTCLSRKTHCLVQTQHLHSPWQHNHAVGMFFMHRDWEWWTVLDGGEFLRMTSRTSCLWEIWTGMVGHHQALDLSTVV